MTLIPSVVLLFIRIKVFHVGKKPKTDEKTHKISSKGRDVSHLFSPDKNLRERKVSMKVDLFSVQRQFVVVDVQLGSESLTLSEPDVQVSNLRGK